MKYRFERIDTKNKNNICWLRMPFYKTANFEEKKKNENNKIKLSDVIEW